MGNHEDPENPHAQLQYQQITPSPKIQTIAKSHVAFTNILKKVRSKPFDPDQIDYGEKKVYTRLMDDLEMVENKFSNFSKYIMCLEVLLFLAHLGCLVASLTIPRIKDTRLLRLRISQWVALSFSIFSGLSVIRLITFIISLPILWWWRIQRYVVFFIHKTKRCADVTLWFGSILFVWYIWFRPRLKHSHGELSVILVRQITRLLISLDLGAFLWFLKDILYFKLEADLHYNQLFDRIRLTVIYFHGLQIIDHNGVWKFLIKNKAEHEMNQRREEIEERNEVKIGSYSSVGAGGADEANKNIWMDVYKTNRETIPIWVLRRLCEEYLYHIQQKKAMQPKPDAFVDDDELKEKAEKMLKIIIVESDRNKRSDILPKDLAKYGLRKEEMNLLFNIFWEKPKHHTKEQEEEGDETADIDQKRISRNQFLNWTVKAFKHCSGLQRTLESSKKVFIKLNRLLSAFVVVVVTLIWLLLSSIVDTGQLALLFSPFLAATFIFGDSCKKMFEGLIFIFAMHPFDVGDRVVIDDKQMKVTEMNILTSAFYKYDTQEVVIYPNSILTTKNIINLDITPDQGDCLDFSAPKDAPPEDIQDLQLSIKKYLDDNTLYTSETKVVKSAIGELDLKMSIHFKYLVSYLSAETKALRKSEILTKIMQLLDDMKYCKRRNYLASRPVIVEFTVSAEATLEQISKIKRAIIRYVACNFEECKQCSKVVMKDITNNQKIKMALYLRKKKKKQTNISENKDEGLLLGDADKEDDFQEEEEEEEDIEIYTDKSMEEIKNDLKEVVESIMVNDSSGQSGRLVPREIVRSHFSFESTTAASFRTKENDHESHEASDGITKSG